jgi:ribulose-phosphate 3-epimerase
MSSDRPQVTLLERRVAPSILSADFGRLSAQVGEVLEAGARVIHVDVMDGHFVPPITFGPVAVSAIADRVHDAGGLIDVHLMIERPEQQLESIARAGADSITIHAEATPHLHYVLQSIRELGCTASVALNPATPIELVHDVAADGALDMVLCMSVNPGWGGQSFIGGSLDKLHRLRASLPEDVALEVDGGINERTVGSVVANGANLLVAGSAVFGSDDPGATYAALVTAAGAD